jgi:serine/threonine-protein kinase
MRFPPRWADASPILDELLDLQPMQRKERLDGLRERDAALADILQMLLLRAEDVQGKDFLAKSVAMEDETVPDFKGQRIGPYVVEAELGSGGTGSVWLARRADGLTDGVVAVKLLHLSLMGSRDSTRLQREGRILSRLTHPNIARLLDAGITTQGQPYLVLEYVDGVPIDEHCDGQALGVEARLRLLRDVASAVTHAHAQFIVHRDIKPSNVLVTKHGQVKLVDFSIGRLLDDENHDVTLTANGQRALTLRYAAPEQLQGEPSTGASDVYSLGVLMYGLLCGSHPTAAPGAKSFDVIRGVIEQAPPRLFDAIGKGHSSSHVQLVAQRRSTSAARLQQQLRGDLDAIVQRALRKRPGERYESMSAFAADLDRYLSHQPVAARAASLVYVSSRFARRHRGTLVGLGAVTLAIAAGISTTLEQARRAEVQRDKAEKQLRVAEASREFVMFLLAGGNEGRPVSRSMLDRGASLIEREFAADAPQRASLQLLLSQLYRQSHWPSMARSMLVRAKDSAGSNGALELRMQIECQLALLADSGESATPALARMDAAIDALRRDSPAGSPTLAECLHGRSELVRQYGGDLDRAVRDAQSALELLREPSPDQQVEAIGIRTTLASLKAKQGRAALAAEEFRSALDRLADIGWGRSEMAGRLDAQLGFLLYRSGQVQEAAFAFEEGARIGRAAGLANPVIASNRARVLADMGRPSAALEATDEALAAVSSEDSPLVQAQVQLSAAHVRCLRRDRTNCERAARRARDLLSSIPHAPASALGQIELVYAELADLQGNPNVAEAAWRRAADEFLREEPPHPAAIEALDGLVIHALNKGDTQLAERLSGRSLRVAQDAQGGFTESAWLGIALLTRGRVEQYGGKVSAHDTFARALEHLHKSMGNDSRFTREAFELAKGRDYARLQ